MQSHLGYFEQLDFQTPSQILIHHCGSHSGHRHNISQIKMYPCKINENLWILGNEYFHICLVRGARACALVETGISATAKSLIDQLSSIKVKPDFIILTHPHSDHITGLNYLKSSFPDAKVVVGKGTESFITHPKAAQSLIAEDLHMTKTMATRGFIEQEKVVSSLPSLAGCMVVNEGDEIILGGFTDELTVYSPQNILNCCRLLVRRVRELSTKENPD